jgi:chromosome segregation ATPase
LLAKIKLDLQITKDRLDLCEADRTKLRNEKDELYKGLEETEYKCRTMENDMEFFKAQFTFCKEQVMRNEKVFDD